MIEIVSFGYGHAAEPAAHLKIDLRPFSVAAAAERRHLTDDHLVRDAMLAEPGIVDLVEATSHAIAAFASAPSTGPVTVAAGCVDGRQHAPAFASVLADWLRAVGQQVTVHHRDLDKPVLRN
jgi:UPF0042 nucleotide-binding protein